MILLESSGWFAGSLVCSGWFYHATTFEKRRWRPHTGGLHPPQECAKMGKIGMAHRNSQMNIRRRATDALLQDWTWLNAAFTGWWQFCIDSCGNGVGW